MIPEIEDTLNVVAWLQAGQLLLLLLIEATLVLTWYSFMNKEITIELYQNESDDEDEDSGEWRPDDDYGDGK